MDWDPGAILEGDGDGLIDDNFNSLQTFSHPVVANRELAESSKEIKIVPIIILLAGIIS